MNIQHSTCGEYRTNIVHGGNRKHYKLTQRRKVYPNPCRGRTTTPPTSKSMDVPTNKRHVSCCAFVIYIVFVALATAVPARNDNESLVDSSPSPWPYYRQVYPGTDPSGETSLELKSLYFALMMSFGGDFRTSGTIPGVQVALDQINSDPTLLPGYQLHYTLTDSQVCATADCRSLGKHV